MPGKEVNCDLVVTMVLCLITDDQKWFRRIIRLLNEEKACDRVTKAKWYLIIWIKRNYYLLILFKKRKQLYTFSVAIYPIQDVIK